MWIAYVTLLYLRVTYSGVTPKNIFYVHRCGTGGSMRACRAAGPGSIPGRDKFPGWGFRGFSSPVRQMSGSFRPQGPRISFGHHNHPLSFITVSNDLRCWRALKPSIYIHIQWVYCTTWPAVARAGEASTYSRRIAYIPANSNHINNFLE